MFSGIVEEIGVVRSLEKGRIEIEAGQVLEDLKIGDSVAVNGCCLTVVALSENSFSADIVPETFRRTNLGKETEVNLERSLQYGSRVSGHLVQGHVDTLGKILGKKRLQDNSFEVSISAPQSVLSYLVEKGSIAIDGVSLTVMQVNDESFSFAMIPHTAEVTILGRKEVGACVNLEVDLMAKYAKRATSI